MARRKRASRKISRRQKETMELKVLVLFMLMFTYLLQPYMPHTEKTFAHEYYSGLFQASLDSLVYGSVQVHSTELQTNSYSRGSILYTVFEK